MKTHGNRIPPEFRHAVSQRIRKVMKPYVKGYGTPYAFCKQMAEDLGCSHMTPWFWYDGQTLPTLYNLARFADYMEVSLDWLFGRHTMQGLPELQSLIRQARKVKV